MNLVWITTADNKSTFYVFTQYLDCWFYFISCFFLFMAYIWGAYLWSKIFTTVIWILDALCLLLNWYALHSVVWMQIWLGLRLQYNTTVNDLCFVYLRLEILSFFCVFLTNRRIMCYALILFLNLFCLVCLAIFIVILWVS
jgi:hypothetical protein